MEKVMTMGSFTEMDERELQEVNGGWIDIIVGALTISALAVVTIDCYCYTANEINKTTAQGNANRNNEPCSFDLIGPSAYVGAYMDGWRPSEGQKLPTYTAYPQ